MAAAAAAAAAFADADLPPPRDLSHHYSFVARNRHQSSTKAFYKFIQLPGISNLSGGMPNVKFFPFDTLEAQVARPERWTPSPNKPVDDASSAFSRGDNGGDAAAPEHLTVPKALAESDPVRKIDLATALQYGLAAGYPPLASFVRQFARQVLHPRAPYRGGPETILTCGATDGFAKTLQLIVEPWSPETGDGLGRPVSQRPGMLCETFLFGQILAQVRPLGVQPVPVEQDGSGMRVEGPGGLREVLENWDTTKGRRPHLLYTVTMGDNPSGTLLPLQRRKEIYALASEYDIIIIEDEPYWYLQYPSAAPEEARSRGLPPPPAADEQNASKGASTGYDFIDSLTPSYISLDVDGRVIRLDTFSKTVAPGCRLGWITAQPAFIERFLRITESTTQQPSGFVQSLIAELLIGPQPEAHRAFTALPPRARRTFEGWRLDGWVRWIEGLRGEYERRMNRMCTILDDNAYQLKQSTPARAADADWGVITKTRLLKFDWPRAGMFVWVGVAFEEHPLWQAKGDDAQGDGISVVDGPVLAKALLMLCTHEPYVVLGVPGAAYSATPELALERGWRYFRLCFAAETDENIEDGALRFAKAIQAFWKIKKVSQIEKLVKELPEAEAAFTGVEF